MERYKVKKWTHIQDFYAEDKRCPRVILSDKDSYAILTCIVYGGGRIKLNTGCLGEPGYRDEGKTLEEWDELFEEIRSVQNHYYNRKIDEKHNSFVHNSD